jgi:rod shape-determining protein MreD
MSSTSVKQIGLFILLVFLQVVLFDKIHLFGYATPLLYVYFILKLPADMNRNWIMILSALMGLCIDLFNYTLGLNMLACVVAGFMRYYSLKLFAPRDIFTTYIPSFATFGKWLFIRYAGLVVLLHQFVLFVVESLSLFDPLLLLYRIVGSFILTMFLIFSFERISLGRIYQTRRDNSRISG